MRYLRKFVQRVGYVSTLLIGGVLGGLMAPLPSEAMTISIDGQNLPVSTLFPYTCETGYSSCWYIIGSATSPSTNTRTITGPTGTWTVANIAGTNRARVRINDLGGTPATNVDKMNLTGIKLTPPANTAGKTTHIIITHTYALGQGSGDYFWGMGATGNFSSAPPPNTVLNNRFVLTGKGRFNSASDPQIQIGKLDKGPFTAPQIAGANGIITQTVNVSKVKTGCNTNSTGFCKPTITYDFQVTVVGVDPLSLTDSMICAGITCTEAQQDPLIPHILRVLMKLIDPTGDRPTRISGLNDWLDDMGVKYRLNLKQLAKLENLKIALGKWFASQSCPGQVERVLTTDSTSGVAQGRALGGTLVTTCSDTNTCGTGTIVIIKTTSPNTIANFGFTGTGSGITDFGIRTDDQNCSEGCFDTGTGSQTFSLLPTGAAGPRTIKETGFPPPPEGNNPWLLDSVNCNGEEGQVTKLHLYDDGYDGGGGQGPLVGIRVNNLNDNQTLTCTFNNVSSYYDDGGVS